MQCRHSYAGVHGSNPQEPPGLYQRRRMNVGWTQDDYRQHPANVIELGGGFDIDGLLNKKISYSKELGARKKGN
jgi:hypothetical protein